MGAVYRDLGQYNEALEFFNHVQNKNSLRLLTHLHETYFRMQDTLELNRCMNKIMISDDNGLVKAEAYARYGNADSCFFYVNNAYENKYTALSAFKVSFKRIKALQDPRYNEFLKKINLPID